MKLKTRLLWMLHFQLVSVLLTLLVLTSGRVIDLEAEQTKSLGGTLTMALIVLGLIVHFQARKGRFRLALVAVMGLGAPLFALINGPFHQVVGYHIVVLGIYGFVIWNLWRVEKNDNPETSP